MSREKIEGYMINLSLTFEVVGDDIWVINDPDKGLPNIIVYAESDLLTIRAKVVEIPAKRREAFFEELLRLNSEVVHGAYAIEESHVIIMDTLEIGTMDLEEFQASLDAIGLALAQHYARIVKYQDPK